MTKFGQFVMGPAGSGKSTYCRALLEHCRVSRLDRRNIKIVNLDPGAEDFDVQQPTGPQTSITPPSTQEIVGSGKIEYDIDVRDLITVNDVMEQMEEEAVDEGSLSSLDSGSEADEGTIKSPTELGNKDRGDVKSIQEQSTKTKDTANENIIGPNGALVYCMEYLAKDDFSWLKERLEDALVDGDYVVFDCPGQIELYTHVPAVKRLVNFLCNRCDFRICGVFMVDAAHFLVDVDKYFSVTLTALSVMINLEGIPFVNVFSKMDIVKQIKSSNPILAPCFLSSQDLIERLSEPSLELFEELLDSSSLNMGTKYQRLTHMLATVIDSYDLIRFQPLNLNKKGTINSLLYYIDTALQYDEEREPRESVYTQAEEEIEGLDMSSIDD